MRHRFALAMALVATLSFGVLAHSPHISASDSDLSSHPFVGVWMIDVDTDDPTNPPELITVHGDGTYTEFSFDGPGVGSWESTGDSTAALTIWFLGANDDGSFAGATIIYASVTVAADGQSFTADYNLANMDATGATTEQYGPMHAMATRLTVEPMGTPVGPASDLYEQGSPVATPAP